MTSCRPYILRAIYQWILDNGLTPFVTIEAEHLDSEIVEQYAKDGIVVINISPVAVVDLEIEEKGCSFFARFGDRDFEVSVPIDAVTSIYAKEDPNAVILFSQQIDTQKGDDNKSKSGSKKPDLHIVT